VCTSISTLLLTDRSSTRSWFVKEKLWVVVLPDSDNHFSSIKFKKLMAIDGFLDDGVAFWLVLADFFRGLKNISQYYGARDDG
jgi:hypothetical protein